MKLRKTLIIPGLVIASALPVGWALAQVGPPPGPGKGPGMGREMRGPGLGRQFGPGMRHANATPEMRARMLEGRIAGAKAALKLDDNQSKLFAPVEEQIRSGFAAREKNRETWRAAREARQAQATEPGKQQPAPTPSLADRLERMSKGMGERAERMKAFSTAFKPFYNSLNDDQKALAGLLLPGAGQGMGRGHHRRWAMNFGGGRENRRGPGMGSETGPGTAPPAPPAPRQ